MHLSKLKRFGYALAILGLGLTLTACGKKNSENDKVTISILQSKVESNKALKSIAKTYQKKHPNVEFKIQSIGGGTDYNPVLKTRISSGNAPTIFSLLGPADVIQFKKYATDLNGTKLAKLANKGTLNTVTDGGKVYGYPYNVEGYGFVYNKEVFEKAGIKPEELTTPDKFQEAVKQIDSKKDELGLDAVFATPGKEAWVFSDHLANLYLGQEFNGNSLKLYKSKSMKFTANQEMKDMLDLEMKYSVKPVMQVDYTSQVNKNFSEKKVAMVQQGNWIYSTIEGIDKDFANNGVGMMTIPVKGQEGKLPVGTSNYWAINNKKSDKEQKAAQDFLTWLYTSKEGKDLVVNKLHYVPAYKGYSEFKMPDALSQQVFNASQSGKVIGWSFPGYTGTPWDQNTMQPALQKYMSGKADWDQTVKTATDGWKKQQAEN